MIELTKKQNMERLLRDAVAAAPSATWERMSGLEAVPDPTATAYRGTKLWWTFVVVSFALPDGGRGYDGTATRSPSPLKGGDKLTVLHLPREAAERFHKMAEKKMGT